MGSVCRTKKLSNTLATGSGREMVIPQPRRMSLGEVVEYVEEGELVEVTPKAVRLQKWYLTEKKRKGAKA